MNFIDANMCKCLLLLKPMFLWKMYFMLTLIYVLDPWTPYFNPDKLILLCCCLWTGNVYDLNEESNKMQRILPIFFLPLMWLFILKFFFFLSPQELLQQHKLAKPPCNYHRNLFKYYLDSRNLSGLYSNGAVRFVGFCSVLWLASISGLLQS